MSNITNATASAGMLSAVTDSVPGLDKLLYVGTAAYLGRDFVRAGYNKVLGLVTGNADRNNASRNYFNQAVTNLPRDLVRATVVAGGVFGLKTAYDRYTFEEPKKDETPVAPELNAFERYAPQFVQDYTPQVVQDNAGKIAGGFGVAHLLDTARAYYQSVPAVLAGNADGLPAAAAQPAYTLLRHGVDRLALGVQTVVSFNGKFFAPKRLV